MTDVGELAVTEDIQAFRARARDWLERTVPELADESGAEAWSEGGEAARRRAATGRAVQRALWEGRLAGITFPPEYGGLGLSVAHRDAFDDEIRSAGRAAVDLFTLTGSLWGLSIGMVAPTMLELGTEEQKRTHIPRMLRGETLWVQMLSEPTGGSDLAGALTRAMHQGDHFVVTGSKIWTSQADVSDMAVLLARTNWDVPKHQGLTMLILPLDAPGLTINPLRLVSGGTGFCQEFFDDVVVPVSDVLGSVDDGWHVVSRLLVHERTTVGGGSTFHTMNLGGGAGRGSAEGGGSGALGLARKTGRWDSAEGRQLAVDVHVQSVVGRQLAARVAQGTGAGVMPAAAGSILRLFGSLAGVRSSDVEMALAGANAVAWPSDRAAPGSALGIGYLGRQGGCMASGTAEIQRNIISERVLGLPREPADDRDKPFGQVRHNALPGAVGR